MTDTLPPPAVKHLRTHAEVAKFLLLKTGPRQLREIGEWTRRPEFPKKQAKGWTESEVRAWWVRFAADKNQELAPMLAAKMIIKGKKIPGKRALQELNTEAGVVSNGAPGEDYRPVESIRQLAPRLSSHFKCHITEQRIKQWLAGELPANVTEPFPLRDPGRNGWNNPKPCFDWVQKNWISMERVQDDLFAKTALESRLADMQRVINDNRRAKAVADEAERAVSDKWILRDVARETGIRAMNDLIHVVEGEHERSAPLRRREKLAALISDLKAENLQAALGSVAQEFHAWDIEDERGRFDRIKEECGRMAKGAEVKAL